MQTDNMKRNYMIRLVLLLFAVISGQSMKAQTFSGGTGTETDPYQIASLDDWNTLAYAIVGNSDQEANNFAGKYFKMTADIGTIANPVTTPLGKQVGTEHSDRKRFAGNFDGGGKTLTVNITNESNDWFEFYPSYCAPFAYVQNFSVSNLHVTGTIITTGQFASGLVGQSGPDGDKTNGACSITNCHVSVTFVGNTVQNKNGNHGTFLAIAEGRATITNCWFDGKLDGINYRGSGGFIGLNKEKATLTDCLFNPTEIASTVNYSGSSEFAHDSNGGTHTLTRCYYITSFSEPEDAQGQRVRAGEAPNPDDYRSSFTTFTDETGSHMTPDGNNYYIIEENYRWTYIQNAMNGTATETQLSKINGVNGSRAVVPYDLVAGRDNQAFVVPAGTEFTLDLNNHILDRDLGRVPAQTNGFVIKVNAGGHLTLEGGTIRGGRNKGNGGGIYNAGVLNLDGVTVTGNYATGNGGGVYHEGEQFCVKGNVKITDNTKNNVYLVDEKTISVYGTLDENASIGVTKQSSTGTIITQLDGYGTVANFFSDNPAYFVDEDEGNGILSLPIDMELIEGDNTTVISNNAGKLANVTLTGRTFYKDSYWNTICLPFDVDNAAVKSVLGGSTELRELTGASVKNGKLTLSFTKVTAIEAGKPYIVKWGVYDNLVGPTFSKVTIKSELKNTNANNIVTFCGTYKPVSFTNAPSILFLGTQNKLYYPQSKPRTVGACRGYFELNGYEVSTDEANGIKAFELNCEEDEDNPTGIIVIEEFNDSTDINLGWYSLDGKKLSEKPAQKGIYVKNGKKVVVK